MKLSKAILWTSGFSLCLYLLGFLGHIIITRSLGVDGRGAYAVLVTSATVIALVCSLGLGAAATVWTARSREAAGQVLVASFTVGGALSVVALIASMAAPREALEVIFPGVERPLIITATLVAASLVLSGHAQSTLLGLERFVPYGLVPLLYALVGLPLYVLLLVVMRMGVAGFMGSWLLLSVASLLTYVGILFRFGVLPAPLDLAWIPRLIPIGVRAMSASVLNALVLRIDVFLIGSVVGLHELGYYSVATGVAELLVRLPQVAGTVVFPRSASGSPDAATSVAQISRFVFGLSVVGAILLALVSQQLLTALYTDAFQPARVLLLILLPGTAAQALSSPVANALAGLGYPAGYLKAHLVALLVNVGLNVAFLPHIGVVGAAVASTVAYVASCALLVATLSRLSSVPISRFVLLTRSDLALVQSLVSSAARTAFLRRDDHRT